MLVLVLLLELVLLVRLLLLVLMLLMVGAVAVVRPAPLAPVDGPQPRRPHRLFRRLHREKWPTVVAAATIITAATVVAAATSASNSGRTSAGDAETFIARRTDGPHDSLRGAEVDERHSPLQVRHDQHLFIGTHGFVAYRFQKGDVSTRTEDGDCGMERRKEGD